MAGSPTRPSVRIGIVGCGRAAGSLHLPALTRVRGATVTALSDVVPERLALLASRCPGASAYPDYRAMLDLKIEGATIVDGTGRAAFEGSVGIAGDRIVEVGPGVTELAVVWVPTG